MRAKSAALVLAGLSVVSLGCMSVPRDPEHTLERVQQEHRIRVGLVEHSPWVVRTSGEPAGAEVELIRRFAATLGATPQWLWDSELQHIHALEHFELDLVAAGLDATAPWQTMAGLTRPYFEERVVVGIPRGTDAPDSLKGITVAVKNGDAAAAYAVRTAVASSISAGPYGNLIGCTFTITAVQQVHG